MMNAPKKQRARPSMLRRLWQRLFGAPRRVPSLIDALPPVPPVAPAVAPVASPAPAVAPVASPAPAVAPVASPAPAVAPVEPLPVADREPVELLDDAPAEPSAASRQSDEPWPLCGVHMDHVRTLVKTHPELAEKDMHHFVAVFILPLTKDSSYVDHLNLDAANAAATNDKADVFVSYAWTTPLETLVDALRDVKGFVWIDALCLNQHARPAVTPRALQGPLANVLQAVGRVHLVATPWHKPACFERAWCTFEHHVAVQRGAAVSFALPASEEDDMKWAWKGGLGHGFFEKMFRTMDVVAAQASLAGDREAITQALRGSEAEVNAQTRAAVRDWLVNAVQGFGVKQGSPEDVHTLSALGCMLEATGARAEALPYYEQAVERCREAYAPGAVETASHFNNLAALYKEQAYFDKAEPLFREAMDINIRALGRDDVDVASDMANLADVLVALARYDDAEPLIEEALDVRARALGPDHADVVALRERSAAIKVAKALATKSASAE